MFANRNDVFSHNRMNLRPHSVEFVMSLSCHCLHVCRCFLSMSFSVVCSSRFSSFYAFLVLSPDAREKVTV